MKNARTVISLFSIGILLFAACQKEQLPYAIPLPEGFPMPEIPADNQLSAERVALGKKLFFDPILSRDSSISCGSCHFQQHAFADPRQLSFGIEGRLGLRNSPSLANIAYRENFFFDGGVPTLELQVAAPIEDHNEMDFNLPDLVARLQAHPTYPQEFKEAYGTEPNTYSLSRAIASFQRTMLSGNSPYDQYQNGATDAISTAAKRGMELFFSDRTACGSCHSGFNFTNEQFENVGLYEDYSADPGRRRVTALESDVGKFKVPSLRNIEVTAPYMHDGSIGTLEEVIDFFDSGGLAHPNRSPLIQPLGLTAQEKADLLAFLESLTDEEFLNNPRYLPEE
jgi:cytochrome c peroxidase